jgi:hypothetical protein
VPTVFGQCAADLEAIPDREDRWMINEFIGRMGMRYVSERERNYILLSFLARFFDVPEDFLQPVCFPSSTVKNDGGYVCNGLYPAFSVQPKQSLNLVIR